MKRMRFSALAISSAAAIAWGMAPVVASFPGGPQANPASDSSKVAEQYFERAVKFLKQENFRDAILQYEKVVQLLPESQIAQDAQYWIGQSYLRMGKYDEALSMFNKLIEKNPGSAIVPVTRLMLARVQEEKEDSRRKTQMAAGTVKNAIIDPATGAKFTKVKTVSGRSDVLENGGRLSPNGKFLLGNVVVPLDGSEPFDLVDMPAFRSTWSPDGKKVAFYSGNAIWYVPVNPETGRAAGRPTRLLDTAFVWQTEVSWAPDSERIVFKRYGDKAVGIWILSLRDRTVHQITDDNGANPRWSPDGKSIAYQKGNQIRRISASGGKPETLLDYSSPVRVIAWSPDGEWLHFRAPVARYLFRLADGHIVVLDPPDGVGAFFSWSLDGKKLLFYNSSYNYSETLRVVSSSGGPSFQLGRELDLAPYVHFWTQDNNRVITRGANDSMYWMIPLAGGKAVPIKLDAKVDGRPSPISLSPDRKNLLFTVVREDGKEDLLSLPVSLEEARTTGPAVAVMRGWDRNRGRREFSYSPDGKTLALTHAGSVWVAYPDGRRPVQITRSSDSPTLPVFSPAGDFVAYVSEDEDVNSKLKVIASSGGDPITLMDHCGLWQYAWSPDGRKIAAYSKSVISVIPIRGGKPEPILDIRREGLKNPAWAFCWLPDGKRIAFIGQRESDRGMRSRIYLVPAAGGKVTELAADDDGMKDFGLFPSPDGRWISYESEGFVKARPESSIWEVNLSDLLKRQ